MNKIQMIQVESENINHCVLSLNNNNGSVYAKPAHCTVPLCNKINTTK